MLCYTVKDGQRCRDYARPYSLYCETHDPIDRMPTADDEAQLMADLDRDLPQVSDTLAAIAASDPFQRSFKGSHAFPRVPLGNSVAAGSHRTCTALTRDGLPCRFPPPTGAERCINHDGTTRGRDAASRAGLASALARRRPSQHLLYTVLSLTDRPSIQAILDSLIRLQFAGAMPVDRARIILGACAVAARNFDRAADTVAGPNPQKHDWFPYFDKVESLLATVDPLLDESDQEDLNPAADAQPSVLSTRPTSPVLT